MDGLVNLYYAFDFTAASIVWGLFGSMCLLRDGVRLATEKIIEIAGTFDMYNFDNYVKPQIEKRFETVYGGLMLFLSYLCQLINLLYPKGSEIGEVMTVSTVYWAMSIGLGGYLLMISLQKKYIEKQRKSSNEFK